MELGSKKKEITFIESLTHKLITPVMMNVSEIEGSLMEFKGRATIELARVEDVK
jgi:hypothetical protein